MFTDIMSRLLWAAKLSGQRFADQDAHPANEAHDSKGDEEDG
jgi:hypothetical protein